MSDANSFADQMSRLANGDPEVAEEVFQRYAARLIGLARARLGGRLQAKLDPEDVIQSVFRTFFVRVQSRGFELHHWDGLWALLAEITCRKCHRQWDRFSTDKRNIRIEEYRDGLDTTGGVGPLVPQPTPEEAAALTDLLEMVFRDLPAHARKILERRLQGYTVPEIATEVRCVERTVYRVLRDVRQQLETICQEALR